jgi:hypothetical protein
MNTFLPTNRTFTAGILITSRLIYAQLYESTIVADFAAEQRSGRPAQAFSQGFSLKGKDAVT